MRGVLWVDGCSGWIDLNDLSGNGYPLGYVETALDHELEIPPMNEHEAKLWYEEDNLLAAISYYCARTGVPLGYAWTYFVTTPPAAV